MEINVTLAQLFRTKRVMLSYPSMIVCERTAFCTTSINWIYVVDQEGYSSYHYVPNSYLKRNDKDPWSS